MDWVTPNKKTTVDAPPCKPADSAGVTRPKALPRLRRLKSVAAYRELCLAIWEPVERSAVFGTQRAPELSIWHGKETELRYSYIDRNTPGPSATTR